MYSWCESRVYESKCTVDVSDMCELVCVMYCWFESCVCESKYTVDVSYMCE